MKILTLVPNYYPSLGGLQEIFKSSCERLVQHYQDDVTVFTTTALQSVHSRKIDFIPAGLEIVNGVKVQRFHFTRALIPFMKLCLQATARLPFTSLEYLRLLRSGPISLEMFRAVYKAEPEIILASPFHYLHLYYPIVRPKGKRVPLVYIGAMHIPPNEKINPVIVKCIQKSDMYIAFTEYERNVLIQNGVSPQKISVIGLGVNPIFYENPGTGTNIRERYNIGSAPLVAFLGRQTYYKGVDTLLYAMQMVWQAIPNAYVLIAGASTDFCQELEKIIQALPAEHKNRVISAYLNGYNLSEAPDLYAACDVFVTVSSQESFGIVYLEAWASKRPVIGGKIGAVESVIRHGVDGLLVPCGDSQALADGIITLLKDDQLRSLYAKNGNEKVIHNHSWDIFTERLRGVCETVLGYRPTP